jgi:hypothetical protein
MIANCEGCEGEQREQCTALFAQMRDEAGSAFTTAMDNEEESNVIGQFELHDRLKESGRERGQELRRIGCTLPIDAIVTRALSESITGVELVLGDLLEQAEDEDRAREGRVLSLVGQVDDRLSAIEKALEGVKDEEAAQEKAAEAAARAYCEHEGWDIENLEFYQRTDLRAHLRELGLL